LPNRGALQPAEIVTIATLASKQLSIEEICEAVDRSPQLVKRALLHSKEMLGLISPEAVASWRQAIAVAGKRGFHQPAKELLEAVGAIERPQPKGVNNVVSVQVGFALPGLPQPPAINVTPLESEG
jgi:hypothetical protein